MEQILTLAESEYLLERMMEDMEKHTKTLKLIKDGFEYRRNNKVRQDKDRIARECADERRTCKL
jgi:hypothetical protein